MQSIEITYIGKDERMVDGAYIICIKRGDTNPGTANVCGSELLNLVSITDRSDFTLHT
jgi:hypothetical protein